MDQKTYFPTKYRVAIEIAIFRQYHTDIVSKSKKWYRSFTIAQVFGSVCGQIHRRPQQRQI